MAEHEVKVNIPMKWRERRESYILDDIVAQLGATICLPHSIKFKNRDTF